MMGSSLNISSKSSLLYWNLLCSLQYKNGNFVSNETVFWRTSLRQFYFYFSKNCYLQYVFCKYLVKYCLWTNTISCIVFPQSKFLRNSPRGNTLKFFFTFRFVTLLSISTVRIFPTRAFEAFNSASHRKVITAIQRNRFGRNCVRMHVLRQSSSSSSFPLKFASAWLGSGSIVFATINPHDSLCRIVKRKISYILRSTCRNEVKVVQGNFVLSQSHSKSNYNMSIEFYITSLLFS